MPPAATNLFVERAMEVAYTADHAHGFSEWTRGGNIMFGIEDGAQVYLNPHNYPVYRSVTRHGWDNSAESGCTVKDSQGRFLGGPNRIAVYSIRRNDTFNNLRYVSTDMGNIEFLGTYKNSPTKPFHTGPFPGGVFAKPIEWALKFARTRNANRFSIANNGVAVYFPASDQEQDAYANAEPGPGTLYRDAVHRSLGGPDTVAIYQIPADVATAVIPSFPTVFGNILYKGLFRDYPGNRACPLGPLALDGSVHTRLDRAVEVAYTLEVYFNSMYLWSTAQ